MGLSSSKKTVVNDPAAFAKQPILDSLADTRATYLANQPALQGFAGQQQATYGRLAPGAEQGIQGAQGVVNDNLSGKNLNGNPYLEGIIGKTREDVTNNVNSQFSSAGRYGSGMYAGTMAKQLADAENNLRFQNYSQERGYQQDAIGQAQNLMGGATGLLNNAAELPWVGVRAQNGGVSGLTSGYGTQTTKSTPSIMDSIAQGVGTAAKAASMFSDERLKDDKQKIGTLPNGLDVFNFTYKADPTDTPQTGVMAQQVEKKFPEAVETDPATGYKKVDYGALGPEAQSIAPEMQAVPGGMMAQPKIKRTFDAPGGTGDKLGQFGDFLLASTGNQAGLLGMQESAAARRTAQQQTLEEQDYQRHRQDKQTDWRTQYDYEVAHPKPTNNDTQADWEFYRQRLNPQEFEMWKQNRINPPRWVQDAMGQWRQVGGAGASGPTPAPAGVTFTPLPEGGPTPPASGTFPRR